MFSSKKSQNAIIGTAGSAIASGSLAIAANANPWIALIGALVPAIPAIVATVYQGKVDVVVAQAELEGRRAMVNQIKQEVGA